MLPRPVILIHDLGGSPHDWDRWGLVSYLVNVGGFDPRLIRRFDFGYVRRGTVPCYDAQGDLILIARRLAGDPAGDDAYRVDALAAESRALGGPDRVSIVAVGAGGIIARYYLSRRTPDALGTVYNGAVDKVILVGAPNRGAQLGAMANALPRPTRWLPWFRRPYPEPTLKAVLAGVEALRDGVLAEMPSEGCPPLSPKSLGLLQISEQSFLLRYLNRAECAPKGVRFHCLAGEITLRLVAPGAGGRRRWELHLGDLLVKSDSATRIAGVRPEVFLFSRAYEVDLESPDAANPLEWFGGDLPPYAHTRLMRQPEVHRAILDILTRD